MAVTHTRSECGFLCTHLALTVMVLIVLAPSSDALADPRIIRVPDDQPTIQAGIDAASLFDTVLVAAGTYYENINFHGKRITVASHFILDRNSEHIENTIINGSRPRHPDTASCVLMISGEPMSTVLEGFTLTGGTGTIWTDEHGFGDFREGGGILMQKSSATIRFNRIVDNEAILVTPGLVSAGGGGIRAGDGSPHIYNNIIMSNRGRYGGGVVLNFATGVLKNNVIAENTGGEDFAGSGVWKYEGDDALLENNTIVGNISAKNGGGVFVSTTSMTIRNNIIWGNVAPKHAQIGFAEGTGIVEHCNIEGGHVGVGNIDTDPMLVGPHYHLHRSSPAVDAGNPAPEYNDPEDPGNSGAARWPALGTLRSDMGAHGGRGASISQTKAVDPEAPK